MLIKSSTSLQNNYKEIADLAREKAEPVYITKDGEGDLVVMSIEAFEKREAILELKEKLLLAEEQRLLGEKAEPLDKVRNRLKEKIDAKLQG